MRLVGHGPVPSSVVVWFLVVLNNNDGMGPCSSLLRCVQLSICERNFTSPRPLTVVVALVASFCPRITGQSKRSLRQHCAHNQGVINSTSASRKLCFMRLRFRPLSGKRGNQPSMPDFETEEELESFRPLSGKRGNQPVDRLGECCYSRFSRFRPLSGKRGNQPAYQTSVFANTKKEFPSPLGEKG